MNAGPFSARLLTNAPLPAWLKEPEAVKAAARQAPSIPPEGVDIAQLALQFSVANPHLATTVAGQPIRRTSANGRAGGRALI